MSIVQRLSVVLCGFVKWYVWIWESQSDRKIGTTGIRKGKSYYNIKMEDCNIVIRLRFTYVNCPNFSVTLTRDMTRLEAAEMRFL